MIKLYYTNASPLANDNLYNAYYSMLPSERRQKTDRLKIRADKNLSLAAYICLDKALTDLSEENLIRTITVTPSGKPYFKDIPHRHFSLSHSGDIALSALCDAPVGVDIQMVCNFREDICRRYFSKSESDFVLKSACDSDIQNNFFRIWTLKEAYSKMTGMGIGDFKNFEIIPDGEITVRTEGTYYECMFYEFEFAGYKGAVCTQAYTENIDIREINLFKLLIEN